MVANFGNQLVWRPPAQRLGPLVTATPMYTFPRAAARPDTRCAPMMLDSARRDGALAALARRRQVFQNKGNA